MKIYLTRHGQTRLNKERLMQGRTDEPLNETGIRQAERMHEILTKAEPELRFDAVYASPLDRAVQTAAIISGFPREQIRIDERILETDFGKYELADYTALGPAMSLYWAMPEIFPAPPTVETVRSMTERSRSFLKDLEAKEGKLENVLVTCHGGIIRALCGYLEDRASGIKWRPKPHNCEVRVYESSGGVHRTLRSYQLDS